jgi:hypothetical protein
VQGASDLHNPVGKPFLGVTKHVFDDPTALDPADTVLHNDTHRREHAIEKLIAQVQVLPFGLLARLLDRYSCRRITLKAGVLKQRCTWGIGDLLGIGHLLVMGFASSRGTQIHNPTGARLGEDQILVRMGFFLPL